MSYLPYSWKQKFRTMGLKILTLVITLTIALISSTPAAWAVDYSKQTIPYSDFSYQDLRGDVFRSSNLRNSDFSHSNLAGARLYGAKLDGANFEGANLSFTTLGSATLKGANLKNAILEEAFAPNAVFDDVIIEGADFTDALLPRGVNEKLCKIATGTNPVTGNDTRDTLFCF